MTASTELQQFHANHPEIHIKYLGGDEKGIYYFIVNETTDEGIKLYFDDETKEELSKKLLIAHQSLVNDGW